MKNVILYTLMICLLCGGSACNKENEPETDVQPAKPIELTVKQSERASADNRFAFEMFKEVSATEGNNTFFSPLSLNMALGMLYNGASGDTRNEMAQVLHLSDFTDAEINEYYQKMSQALLNIDPRTDIGIANSIWYHNTLIVKQPFIDTNKTYFDASVQSLDFSKPASADVINNWCAAKTKDRIKEIISPPLSGSMYLINALYFKSRWQFEFDKAKSKQDVFTKTGNQELKVTMMEQTTTLPYYSDQYLQCVEMPYGNQAFSMMAVLPGDNMSIDQLIAYLDNTSWQHVVDNMHQQKVWLKLPRFKVECELMLNGHVSKLGMQKIFSGGFANITDTQLAVSLIKQKTFVEVNEEGTEAAAVTIIGMDTYAGPDTEVPFFANRPFLYLIKEKSTGVILFIGRMDEPK